MKLLILIAILAGTTVYGVDSKRTQEEIIVEAMVSSFYTGCMSGIISVIEEGLFKAGKNSVEANKNFYRLKQNCIKQQIDYKKFLETK